MKYLLCSVSLVAGLILETAATAALLELWRLPGGIPPLAVVLVGHLLACICFIAAAFPFFPEDFRRARVLAICLPMGFGALLPVIGPISAAIMVFWIVGSHVSRVSGTEYYFGETPYLTPDRKPSGAGRNARSITDLLQSPDVDVRRKAVLAVRNLAPKAALPILRQAQQDSDEQVRIFAGNFLGRIVESLASSLKMAHDERLKPTEQLERFLHVVDQYQEFVDLGLLTEGSRTTYVDKALALLAQLRLTEPDNEKTLVLQLKLNLLAGDLLKAKASAQRLKELSCNANIMLPWELQIHFQNRDWIALHETLLHLERHCFNDPQFRKIYDFWRRSDAPENPSPSSSAPSAPYRPG